MSERIYLDYNATAPAKPEVVEAVAGILARGGNASSSTPILADRMIAGGTKNNSKSYWSSTTEDWKGNIGFGDAHSEFEDDPELQDTRYSAVTCDTDDLHQEDTSSVCASENNALMIQYGATSSGVTSP